MTTTTTRYAFPKPELTDLVTDGWDAIADLADAVDVNLGNVADQAAADADAAAAASIARATVTALGDLLVGTGPGAVARLPRGATGQQLKVAADGTLFWETPPATDLSSRVAKAGDTMTGPLGGTTATFSGQVQGGTVKGTAGVYDGAARVYSSVNPPPAAGGAVINQTIRGSGSPGGGLPLTVTIPSVVMAKCQLRWHGTTSATPVGTSTPQATGAVVLTSTTAVTCHPPASNGSFPQYFELTEWS